MQVLSTLHISIDCCNDFSLKYVYFAAYSSMVPKASSVPLIASGAIDVLEPITALNRFNASEEVFNAAGSLGLIDFKLLAYMYKNNINKQMMLLK